MLVVRLLGGGLFVAALFSLVWDVRGLWAGSALTLTNLETLWLAYDPGSLASAKGLVVEHTAPWVWSYLVEPLLLMPVALIGSLAGYALLGTARKRQIENARRLVGPDGKVVPLTRRDAAQPNAAPALAGALASCRGAFAGIALFSGMSNVLLLTGSMFMLEVYDRVLPSRSIPTLIGLSILAAVLFMAQGGFDLIRSRLLGRVGVAIPRPVRAGAGHLRPARPRGDRSRARRRGPGSAPPRCPWPAPGSPRVRRGRRGGRSPEWTASPPPSAGS